MSSHTLEKETNLAELANYTITQEQQNFNLAQICQNYFT